ncbi:hypothetical protein FCR2A7T_22160 [Flavobacterium cauense R2A-7]|nr:hypothetical protein FCR2A7T_22160 [Flavobacterium cauense R2A-7]
MVHLFFTIFILKRESQIIALEFTDNCISSVFFSDLTNLLSIFYITKTFTVNL